MAIFIPKGVCSSEIAFEIHGDVVFNVKFIGGCPGNLVAISRLVDGMPVSKAVELLKGVRCGAKTTSCSDQLALALENARKARKIDGETL
ncbi:MAG: TIGR03905 family TSCPD domain-containing protein [Acidaminococcaceae bacterium]